MALAIEIFVSFPASPHLKIPAVRRRAKRRSRFYSSFKPIPNRSSKFISWILFLLTRYIRITITKQLFLFVYVTDLLFIPYARNPRRNPFLFVLFLSERKTTEWFPLILFFLLAVSLFSMRSFLLTLHDETWPGGLLLWSRFSRSTFSFSPSLYEFYLVSFSIALSFIGLPFVCLSKRSLIIYQR